MRKKQSNLVQKAWRGEARFWRVYWTFGAFGVAVVWAIGMGLLPAIHDSVVLELVGLALVGCYLTWAGALMWRCAAKVKGFEVYAVPFLGFAWFGSGIAFLAVALWLALAKLGLPVGLESPG